MDRSWVPSGVPDDDYSSPSSPPPTYLQRRRHLTDRELEQRSHSPLVGRYPSHSTSSTVHSPAPAGEHQAGLSFTPSASQTSSTELPSSKIQFTPEERYPFLQQEPPSIVQSRERAVSASKSPKGGLSFFRRRSSAAADKQSKKAAVKTPRKSSSPAVFDPQFRAIPYRTSVEILQPLPIPSSTKSHDNPASAKGRKSSSASFLQNVKRKASRVFSKTSNPVSPPAPNVPAPIPVGVSQFRTSSSYSRESPVNSAWEDEPLLTRANHNVGAEQYAELVAELQDLHEDSNPREDSPTLGRQTLTTPHRPRLHRVSSKRRRSVFFEQPKTRTSSTFPRATRGPDSDALGISSGDPFQQSPSPPPRQDSPTAERQRSYLTTSRTSPEVSTRNPFTRNDADSAARLQRRETRRRELDSRRALVESIGYSTPRIPPKTRAPATAAETETSSGSQSQSSFGAPGGSVITQSPLYNRHPAYRRLPPRSESATSTKKPFNEVDFAKPFPRLGVPAPTEGKADLDLDLVDEEEEGEREKKASERAEDASLVRTPGPRRPRERQDRESPGTDAIESTRTGPPQRREEQSSNLRASKAKAGVSVKSPLPSSQQRIEGAAGGKLSDVCQRAERLESIIGGASGAPKTSSVTGEVVPVTSDPTLTTSESIPGISISKRANSNIAGVPTPRRAAGSKVASLLKKFDQPGSSPVVPPSQTRPSEVTKSLPPVESEPNEEDSDSPPLIPRKSSARARKAVSSPFDNDDDDGGGGGDDDDEIKIKMMMMMMMMR
ncbi:MAG: hypothetical protein M1818_005948 [Claussenomyces sp. TS43310]|nr:MAG: hypothetical protein M1818_005948 [Claussenomyces sp. TS43310]